MCGIAGVVDLSGRHTIPDGVIQAMADSMVHRGPDEDGYLNRPRVGLVSRRLSIVGLADGRQPISNEDGSISVVYNGELFEYPEIKSHLESKGHRFATHCDTEVIPHLWEEYGEDMFDQLRGQFALALWDQRRQVLILARDRFGICPLHWSRQTRGTEDWLVFASEIKALLASGLVPAKSDWRGVNQIFTFFALPGPSTCFEGVEALVPGHRLSIDLGRPKQSVRIHDRAYWEIDFPDRGQEDKGTDSKKLLDEFESLMLKAVERRLRADVPVVAYLSGGVDSSLVVALAAKIRGHSVPTFTISIQDPDLNESREADLVARHVGAKPVVVPCGRKDVLETYPALIRAAEAPVIDTACAAMLMLAQEVHAQGYKVALTGEGADEWLAGYPWYKVARLLSWLDIVPGLKLSQLSRRAYLRLTGAPRFPWALTRRNRDALGGPNAWLDVYGLMSMSKLRLFSRPMLERSLNEVPYEHLGLNLDRARRWHPLNRSIYMGGRVMLPGLLLNAKGDRVAMNSSVETRYPFLDEEVFTFLARLHPSWKLRRLCEKYILRRLAERWLPRSIAWRPKAMFRAPFDSFSLNHPPPYVDQLLSEISLRRTGYFDPQTVNHWRQAYGQMRHGSHQRTSIEMGLVGVVSTQLWHHTFIDSSLADLPSFATAYRPSLAAS
ncbi:MAG TPA: asparagine synthase (glutamine-hydrolyzing) [Gemmataceae bacterium]|nr:asparagine synthase (glutamine-hydrolyzing) [Gemmataceae bacterium]